MAKLEALGFVGAIVTRNALKFSYWRTKPPARDWVGSAAGPFDFERADWNSKYGGIMSSCVHVSRRFFWLCNEQFPELLGVRSTH